MPPPRPRPPRPRPRPGPRPRRHFRGGGYPYAVPGPYWPEAPAVFTIEREAPPARGAEAPFRILSRIYEDGIEFPVVVHAFNGKTLEQAQRFFLAHQKTDAFLSGCMRGRFGKIRCREEHVAERWDGRSWRRA